MTSNLYNYVTSCPLTLESLVTILTSDLCIDVAGQSDLLTFVDLQTVTSQPYISRDLLPKLRLITIKNTSYDKIDHFNKRIVDLGKAFNVTN